MKGSTRKFLTKFELNYLRDTFWKKDSLGIIKSKSPRMLEVLSKIRSVAPTRSTVLLQGETGVGKGVLARLIHNHSDCCNGPFLSVHCGAIPETLLESELFGHEKGAFTGAMKNKQGCFELAKNGTIFLDEISTVTQATQIRLLQVLQDKTFRRLGGQNEVETNVRIVSASNVDLMQMMQEGTFRKDLFYRLNIFPIRIPPLRERLDDIELLTSAFLEKLNRLGEKCIHDIHPDVIESFKRYNWPGNIRELENIMERAFVIENTKMLMPSSFSEELLIDESSRAMNKIDAGLSLAEIRQNAIETSERKYLIELLSLHNGRIGRSSKSAGIGPRQFNNLLRKYKIRKEEFKNKMLTKVS